MLKDIISPTIANLKQTEILFNDLSVDVYSNKATAPYYSSIGGHLRHILDVFQCVFNGIETKVVDLTDRKRGTLVEENPQEGLNYLKKIITKLESIAALDSETVIILKDDLGEGMLNIHTTLGAALYQAHSHAIHHFACIGYLIHIFGIKLPGKAFGYNPTTPINKLE